jgi:hypothetical protein
MDDGVPSGPGSQASGFGHPVSIPDAAWPNDQLSAVQIAALARLGELGMNPYGWSAADVGRSGKTLAALEERMLIFGGHIYGRRTRSYIITDRGKERLAQAMSAGTAKTPQAAEGRSPASAAGSADAPE